MTKDKKHWTDMLIRLGACREAVVWARGYESIGTAWRYCKRGDWMLWYAGKIAGEPESEGRRRLVLCACKCARLSLRYVPKAEKRPLKAIQTAEAWAKKKKGITLQDVRAAAAAAADAAAAAAAADAAAAAYSAYAAADAAAAAYSAYAAAAAAAAAAAYSAYAAAAAAADAAAAAYSAYAAAAYAAVKLLSECAGIAREFYPTPPKDGGR